MDKINKWEEELDLLQSIIAQTELKETIKWGSLVYTSNDKNILGINGFKNYFTIWFFNGVFLKDEKNKLVNAQEGKTKSLRQWRFTSKESIDEKLILKYIHEAIENEKLGKSILPDKKPIVISDYLKKELNENEKLKTAFEKFAPYKQKEFIEYIDTAKRVETKRTRMTKIKPMILENIGLNDKHR